VFDSTPVHPNDMYSRDTDSPSRRTCVELRAQMDRCACDPSRPSPRSHNSARALAACSARGLRGSGS
jgi:hypothetical protein